MCLKAVHTPTRLMLMAAASSSAGRALVLSACTLFISFSTSLHCEATPGLVNQAAHKYLFSTHGFQTPRPYCAKLLMSFSTPLDRPALKPGIRNRAWSCCSILTTQMLERAWSSAFTRKPPKSESISRPPVLANSTLGSRPTAATMWSVST